MSSDENTDVDRNMEQLAEAVKEFSVQVEILSKRVFELSNQVSREESELLEKYKEEGTLLEFTLVTGGLIIGRIVWVGNSSLGIETESGEQVILYKHAIAFVQKAQGN